MSIQFDLSSKSYAHRSRILQGLQFECDRAELGEPVDLDQTSKKLHSLMQAWTKDHNAIQKGSSIPSEIEKAHLIHKQQLDRLDSRIKMAALFPRKDSIHAKDNLFLYTGLSIAAVASVALGAFLVYRGFFASHSSSSYGGIYSGSYAGPSESTPTSTPSPTSTSIPIPTPSPSSNLEPKLNRPASPIPSPQFIPSSRPIPVPVPFNLTPSPTSSSIPIPTSLPSSNLELGSNRLMPFNSAPAPHFGFEKELETLPQKSKQAQSFDFNIFQGPIKVSPREQFETRGRELLQYHGYCLDRPVFLPEEYSQARLESLYGSGHDLNAWQARALFQKIVEKIPTTLQDPHTSSCLDQVRMITQAFLNAMDYSRSRTTEFGSWLTTVDKWNHGRPNWANFELLAGTNGFRNVTQMCEEMIGRTQERDWTADFFAAPILGISENILNALNSPGHALGREVGDNSLGNAMQDYPKTALLAVEGPSIGVGAWIGRSIVNGILNSRVEELWATTRKSLVAKGGNAKYTAWLRKFNLMPGQGIRQLYEADQKNRVRKAVVLSGATLMAVGTVAGGAAGAILFPAIAIGGYHLYTTLHPSPRVKKSSDLLSPE